MAILKWFLNLFRSDKSSNSSNTPQVIPHKDDPGSKYDDIMPLAVAYIKAKIEYPSLKPITLAQWMLESDYGKSDLAIKSNNYASLSWRGDLGIAGATAKQYGDNEYAELRSLESFIEYYWKFLNRPVYDGWRNHASNEEGFIQFLVNKGYTGESNYVSKVVNLLPDATEVLDLAEEQAEDDRHRDSSGNNEAEPTDPREGKVDEPDEEPKHETEKNAGLLWYPKRFRYPKTDHLRMKTRGSYSYGYPEGAVVHFTAGRSRNKEDGGSRNGETHVDVGVSNVKYAVNKGSYAYFVIDRDGNVYQNHPLNKYGYHAGSSSWKSVGGNVSDNFVGIEVLCAGKLSKTNGGYKSWFTKVSRGDKLFGEDEVRHSEAKANIKAGTYHKFSEKQEEALKELILWLGYNSPLHNGNPIFKLENVAGHDEISPFRKNDPGFSLSMTMPEFRQSLVA